MIEILRVIDELEEVLDELLSSGAGALPPSFFLEMKRECERYGLSYAVTQLLIMEEERNKARFLHNEEKGRLTEAFCKLQQYIQIVRIEMLHL
ncbi:hypothetical protein [Priestia abyssalis]|uniref:hypothetical protein n=1 Tax=Priestia abyssalis TaxID=1221450 RepID=UPI000994C790|nr:hypothetical protein [Priestia abyssalis]